MAFVLLTIFMSIRFNFGNDYVPYLNLFLEIGKYNDIEFLITEIGWNFLCLNFQPLGFLG